MKTYIKKVIAIIVVAAVFLAAMLVLSHTVKNGRQTESLLPTVTDTPVYVECEKGQPLTVEMTAKEDFSISGFQLLLVNISAESRGTLHMVVKDAEGNALTDQVTPVDTLSPGEWFEVPCEISFAKGANYTFTLTADSSSPYFMELPKEEINSVLPFEENVINGTKQVESGISLGVNVVTPVAVTFGEIFYFSIPVCCFLAVLAIILILFGYERVADTVKRIPVKSFVGKYGNELFLLLLFAAICISIYSRAYLKGVYITSDSAGYLREAVSMVNGQGFRFDGMAGYDSWFANWPILYPVMIALVMMVTGTEAYLASKILSMIMVFLILVVLRLAFKKDAWFYALCLTNIGFLNLTYYTWSEIPFMLVLLCFSLVLAKILKQESPSLKWYLLLGIMGTLCFLTRYFGIFVWMVVGLYLLSLLYHYWKKKEKTVLKKGICLTITAGVSGCVSLFYLLVNKWKSGMASGVSRTLWWDDYEKLTNDLIESLLTEICNVFSIQIPQLIENFPFSMKVLVLAVIFLGLFLFIRKNCQHFTVESVMITMAVCYYIIFIGIRYVSSMDTFYFRFFEPASFLFCLGIFGLILPEIRGKNGFHYFGGAVTALIAIAVLAVFANGGMDRSDSYYQSLTRQWDAAYAEIPEKSVIIFSDIDFRSSYYRPDVAEGMIYPSDSFEGIQNTYYGSDYLCIKKEFAKTMLEEGEYEESIKKQLQKAMETAAEEDRYLVIALR